MVTKYVLVGIIVGVFVTGIAVGYSIWANTYGPGIMKGEVQKISSIMMQDPESRQQMMAGFMKNPQLLHEMFADPQFMQEMMKDQQFNQMMSSTMMQDPQHIEQMSKAMKENHEFMQKMMSSIIDDPDLRLQMLGHMTENQETMQQMKQMMQGNMTRKGMDSGMMMGGK